MNTRYIVLYTLGTDIVKGEINCPLRTFYTSVLDLLLWCVGVYLAENRSTPNTGQ